MDAYARIATRLGRALKPYDAAREKALGRSRDIVRLSSNLIRGLHRGAWDDAAGRLLEKEAETLRRIIREAPALEHHGAVTQAFGEYAEAQLLRAYLERRAPPPPTKLRIPPGGYLLGLGDLVGELRRVVLSRLLSGNVKGAEHAFDSMEKVYEALHASEAPTSIVPVREKTDAARSMVDRTRGELLTAKRAKELERKIDGVGRLLDEAEGRPPKRHAKKDPDALDLDAAWNKD